METTIRDIQQKLQKNAFPNEASISQGIVLRIVRELGWDVYDIDVVAPEYTIGTQRADFALCHPPRKPLVLIEVKQPGTMSAMAEEQLATYAFGQGVPLVVLTSGADWHFYAPYGPGLFKDRRIHRLDLTERTAEDAAERFQRYLSYDAWLKGTASVSVQTDLQEMLGKQETRRRLPEAWAALVNEPHPQLIDLLAAELERLTGSEPPRSEVVSFLANKSSSKPSTEVHVKKPVPIKNPVLKPSSGNAADPKTNVSDPKIKLIIDGKQIPVKNNRDRFIEVLDHLARHDSTLLDELSGLVPPGRRPTVAQTPQDLYPKNPGFAKKRKTAWRELPSKKGWFVDVNKSAEGMLEYIKLASKHADVELGKEIIVE